jgi:hypothetical protein
VVWNKIREDGLDAPTSVLVGVVVAVSGGQSDDAVGKEPGVIWWDFPLCLLPISTMARYFQ